MSLSLLHAGCPHLTQQVWDSTNTAFKPLRHLLDEACSLFPAFPSPFLQLATGLSQGHESAAACYSYLCNKPCLTVEYEANTPGVVLQGEEAILDVDMPWAKAPDVEGSTVPQVGPAVFDPWIFLCLGTLVLLSLTQCVLVCRCSELCCCASLKYKGGKSHDQVSPFWLLCG